MNTSPRILGVLAAIGLSALTACGATATATPTVTQTTVVTMTAEPTATSSPPEVQAPAPANKWVMPNRVGTGLQDSQDAIQAITGHPLYVTRSHDALEEGRFQVIDSNWQVCSQSPAPGTQFTTDTDIVFNVVKLTETCP